MQKYATVAIGLCIISAGMQTACAEEISKADLLINQAIPGWVQIKEGNPEGWFLVPGGILEVSGTIAVMKSSSPSDSSTATQLFSNDWTLKTGLLLSEIGMSQTLYSDYKYITSVQWNTSSLSLGMVLGSPFDPNVILDYRVLPFVLLEVGVSTIDQLNNWHYFLEADKAIRGLPTEDPPMVLVDAMIGCAAGYAEELLFHGIIQPKLISSGYSNEEAVLLTATLFGASHLGNMLIAPPESGNDWLNYIAQASAATLVGVYNGKLALEGSDGLRKAIAVHSLNNIFAAISNAIIRAYSNRETSTSHELSMYANLDGIVAKIEL